MNYASYEVKFWDEDFKKPEEVPVKLTKWEVGHLLRLLEDHGDEEMEISQKLCRALRSFF